jgi:hypothetical protein
MKRRLIIGFSLALILGVLITNSVLALANITLFNAIPTSNSISFSWTKVPTSTKTMIRFLTTTYPTDSTGTTDASYEVYFGTGTSFNATFGTDILAHVLTITSGTTYYISAWGWDGVNYSTDPYEFVVTTYGIGTTEESLPTATLPSNMNQTPNSSAWFDNMQPFSGMVASFAADWGMPQDNGIMLFAILVIVIIGVAIYLKTRNLFVAYAVVLAGDLGATGLHLVAGWFIFVLIAVGLGVWAVEHNFQ